MNVHRGDVLIAFIPNADGSPSKVRPVLVVQSDIYNVRISNLIVAAITTNLKNAKDPATLLIDVNTPDDPMEWRQVCERIPSYPASTSLRSQVVSSSRRSVDLMMN